MLQSLVILAYRSSRQAHAVFGDVGAALIRVRNCFGNSFFFFFFFFLVGGGFGAVQALFWENPGVKGRFVRVLGHLGVVLGLSRLRSGETSGEMQVPSRFGHKKLLQKTNCPVYFCFLCVFIYVDVCVCVCESNSVPKRSKI